MKLLSTTAALLSLLVPVSAGSLAARAPAFFDYSQSPIKAEDGIPVNGNNPLTYCSDPSTNTLKIDRVDLTPNPPLPGQTLTIDAKGTVQQEIQKGATVLIEVKYGLITLLKQSVDLCDQIENVDLQCPVKEGNLAITKQVDLPKQIPPGKYNVHADVYNANGDQITCLEANNIEFKLPL